MHEQIIQNLVDAGKLSDAANLAEIDGINGLQSASVIFSRIRDERSILLAQVCVALNPRIAQLHGNLSYVLSEQGHFDEALESIDRAIAIDPLPDFLQNKAMVLTTMKRSDEAINLYKQILEIQPDRPAAKFYLGCLYVNRGDFAAGLPLLESRFDHNPELNRFRKRFSKPDWTGQDLAGKRLLVYNEQGIGDALQFLRYVPKLKEAFLIVEAQEELKPILAPIFDVVIGRSRGYDTALPPDFPEYDFVVSFSSLPLILDPDLSLAKSLQGYIRETGDDLPLDNSKLNVGLVWAGSQWFSGDASRSFAAKTYLPLSKLPGVQLYGLQKGEMNRAQGDLSEGVTELNLIDLSPKLADLRETAKVIDQLDLVITVDSSIGHLAGAMGKPAFILLPYIHDHRWTDGPTTFWYENTRLIRQKTPGDWDGVIAEVVASLQPFEKQPNPVVS